MDGAFARVLALLAAHLPSCRVDDVAPLGEGLDNAAYLVNSDLVVRLSKEPDAVVKAASVAREAELLSLVAARSPLPVPEPIAVAQDALVYRMLPGVPLIDIPVHRRGRAVAELGAVLGAFLATIQAIPTDQVTSLVDDDPFPVWLIDAAECLAAVVDDLRQSDVRRIEVFLASTPPQPTDRLVFSHNDLGIEHLLVDPATLTVTGVIDWSDAALVDPAYDIGLLLRDLGPEVADIVVARQSGRDHDALRRRAWFYARCSVLEDLRFGVEHGRRTYVMKSLEALGRLFG